MKKVSRICGIILVAISALAVVAYFSVRVKRLYDTRNVKTGHHAVFNDNNALQLTAADRMGITPQDDDSRIPQFVKEGKLVKLHSCSYYYITASMPYLTPEAADLLAEIGKRYKNESGNKIVGPKVTSMFRTKEYVKELQKSNGNAVKNSCHLRGTTFDISYAPMNPKEKRAMEKVLGELRSAGYCYVMYEVKQSCFHITVRK